MTLEPVPDPRLISRGWEAKLRTRLVEFPDHIYTKPGTYGWFDQKGAWSHELGDAPQQYPSFEEGMAMKP